MYQYVLFFSMIGMEERGNRKVSGHLQWGSSYLNQVWGRNFAHYLSRVFQDYVNLSIILAALLYSPLQGFWPAPTPTKILFHHGNMTYVCVKLPVS